MKKNFHGKITALEKELFKLHIFLYFSIKSFVVAAHWKRLNETLPMSSHNNGFNREMSKISSFFNFKKEGFLSRYVKIYAMFIRK